MNLSALTSLFTDMLKQQKLKHVQEAFLRVHERYQQKQLLPLQGAIEHLAYALYRMPATYAAVKRSLDHMSEVIPEFTPSTSLDLGVGPGTAIAAASFHFSKPITSIGLDKSRFFIDLCQRTKLGAEIRESDLEREVGIERDVDLALATYSFGELSQEARERWLKWLSLHTKVALLVEPGTPEGWRTLMECRDLLIGQGARIAAPCPHHSCCPFTGTRWWCHESVRLPRTRYHQWIKDCTLNYEDEKFCYQVAVFDPTISIIPTESRVVNAPKHRSGHTHLSLCTEEGKIKNCIISRRNKEAYAVVKRLCWGDRFQETETK